MVRKEWRGEEKKIGNKKIRMIEWGKKIGMWIVWKRMMKERIKGLLIKRKLIEKNERRNNMIKRSKK